MKLALNLRNIVLWNRVKSSTNLAIVFTLFFYLQESLQIVGGKFLVIEGVEVLKNGGPQFRIPSGEIKV
jgi:hypothetical protein